MQMMPSPGEFIFKEEKGQYVDVQVENLETKRDSKVGQSRTLFNPRRVSIYHQRGWCHQQGQIQEGPKIPKHGARIGMIKCGLKGQTDPQRGSREYQHFEQAAYNILRPPNQDCTDWTPLGKRHQQKTNHQCHRNPQSAQMFVVFLLVWVSSRRSPRWQEGQRQGCSIRNKESTNKKRKTLGLKKESG